MALKKKFISYGKNVYGKEEINAVIKTLKRTTQMSSNVNLFERKLCKFFSKKYSLMVNSGTSALILAIKIFDFPKNSEIITPGLNFGTAVSSIILNDLQPVFVDIERDTLQINPDIIEKRISKKTRALLIPNLIGNIPDWIKIKKIAKKYKLKIIEDCAESHGVEYKGKKVGSIGDVGVFSFFSNKTITCGEGGMIVTNSFKLAKKARLLKNLAYGIKNRFMHSDIGFNYRMSNISAALGLGQLKNISSKLKEKKRIYSRYKKNLKNIKGIKIPKIKDRTSNFIMWLFNIYLEKNFPISRNELVKILEKKGIETRNAFVPINKQKVLIKKYKTYKRYNCINSNYIMNNGFYLPSGNNITNQQIDKICKIISTIALKSK